MLFLRPTKLTIAMKNMFSRLCFITLFALALVSSNTAMAQFGQKSNNTVVNYKTISDEPYGLNRFWLHFQPLVFDIYMTNFTLGYGLQVNYMVTDKIHLRGHYRGAYAGMGDMMKYAASKNAALYFQDEVRPFVNRFNNYTNVEVGGAYYFKDEETKGIAKIVLTSKKRKQMEFYNADFIEVNAKVRKMMGGRFGAFGISSTYHINRVMRIQGKNEIAGIGDNNQTYIFNLDASDQHRFFGNMTAVGAYLGGSYSVIRNVSIKADRYGDLANNIIFNTYADLMIAPYLDMANPIARVSGTPELITLQAKQTLRKNYVGWRLGFDVMYNQDSYWAFGGELGMRPGVRGQAFFAMCKIAFPVLSFKFSNKRTAADTGGIQF
jgi:hypothetical protein